MAKPIKEKKLFCTILYTRIKIWLFKNKLDESWAPICYDQYRYRNNSCHAITHINQVKATYKLYQVC